MFWRKCLGGFSCPESGYWVTARWAGDPGRDRSGSSTGRCRWWLGRPRPSCSFLLVVLSWPSPIFPPSSYPGEPAVPGSALCQPGSRPPAPWPSCLRHRESCFLLSPPPCSLLPGMLPSSLLCLPHSSSPPHLTPPPQKKRAPGWADQAHHGLHVHL